MGFRSTQEQLFDGIREVRFWLPGPVDDIPGLAYLPATADDPLPLVLLQHPATSSKDDYFVADVARQWVRRGWICGGIDAPLHGDREQYDPMAIFRHPERFPDLRTQFATEITDTIDAMRDELPVDISRLGYVGYSMGSMLGVPAVAQDGRFKAAVFCLVGEGGLVGPAEGEESFVPGLAGVAVRIVAKEHDELVPRAATEALYNAIPGEKDIVWLPGGHFEIGPDVVEAASDWLKEHL